MSDFVLPKGYVAWCHICAKPPFNKLTAVRFSDLGDGVINGAKVSDAQTAIPGIGFKSLDELRVHNLKLHREWKG